MHLHTECKTLQHPRLHVKGICSKEQCCLQAAKLGTMAQYGARCSARPITNKPTFVRRDLRGFLKSERCHLASQRSGSGGGPGLAGSKPAGYRGLRFLLFFLPFFPPSSAAAYVKTEPSVWCDMLLGLHLNAELVMSPAWLSTV
jgi:hypothetical protein